MKQLKHLALVITFTMFGCISWVFAKSPYSEMPAGNYALDLTHASIVWKVSHLGLSDYTARFADFDAEIDFNPDNIASSKVTATINPMSIQTAYPNADEKDFDKALATEEGWFNAGKYSAITFTSTNIDMTSDTTAKMTGNLTFLGVTKPVTLDVTFNGAMLSQPFSKKPTLGFSATTSIMRSEFGMTKYVPNIGDQVDIWIEGEFAKTDD